MIATPTNKFPFAAARQLDTGVDLLHQRVETLQMLGIPLDQADPFLLEPLEDILTGARIMRERITLS